MKEHSILFVDDEEINVRLGKEMLESLGFRVITQTNSMEALRIFRINPKSFDLVITDYNMPQIKGDQLAIELRSIRFDIPIILCTASSNLTPDIVGKWGINELIIKPYSTEEISKAIRENIYY